VKVFTAINTLSGVESGLTLQNRIEIRRASGQVQFSWSTSTEFAGASCDIVDLDDDGTKEFVLRAGPSAVRVVSYRQGVFRFRDQIGDGGDELLSSELDVLDIDGDDRLEFVSLYYLNPGYKEAQVRVHWWTREGFRLASADLGRIYQDRFSSVGR
jgi:hypothetical protein